MVHEGRCELCYGGNGRMVFCTSRKFMVVSLVG